MDKILNITDRLEDKKRKRNEKSHRQKAEALQRIVRCSSCRLSCAMCGSHFDVPDTVCPPASSYPDILPLCDSCGEEYNDFMAISEGKKGSDIFWHNAEWVSLWASWLEYHKAIEGFMNSKEFNKLLKKKD